MTPHRAVDAERQAAAAACTTLLATIDRPAARRAFEASLSRADSGRKTCICAGCRTRRNQEMAA